MHEHEPQPDAEQTERAAADDGRCRRPADARLEDDDQAGQDDRQARENAGARKSQVGTGDRSEKIRTYNFPQNRVTDHRVQMSWHNLGEVMEGNIRDIQEEVKLNIGKERTNDGGEDTD